MENKLENIRKFIESKGCKLISDNYFNNHTPIEIEMRCGHIVTRRFQSFKFSNRTYLCSECANNYKCLDNIESVSDFLLENNCKFISASDVIIKHTTKISYITRCGHEIISQWSHLKNKNIPKCKLCNRKLDIEEIKKITLNRGCEFIEVLFEYKNTILIYKSVCGCTIKENFVHFKNRKHGYCNNHRKLRKFDIDEIKKIFENNGCELLDNQYINCQKKLEYVAKCGHLVKNSFMNFSKSKQKNCLNCINLIQSNYDDVKFYFEKKNCILISNNYISASQKLEYYAKCGHQSIIYFTDFKRGQGLYCKKCRMNRSTGEALIKNYLDENKIVYIEEKIFEDCKYKKHLRFDFYLPHNNLIIEFDGNHHFEYKKLNYESKYKIIYKKDMIKNMYCYKKNMRLLRISYSQLNNINDILKNNFNNKRIFSFIGKEYEFINSLLKDFN